MTDEQTNLKMWCLEQACSLSEAGHSKKDVIEAAEAFYEFITEKK